MTIADRPPTPTAALAEAIQHYQAGRIEQAEQLYRKILAGHPGEGLAMFLLAVLLLGRVQKAGLGEALDLAERFLQTPAVDGETLADLRAVISETLPLGRILDLATTLARREKPFASAQGQEETDPTSFLRQALLRIISTQAREAQARDAQGTGAGLGERQMLLGEVLRGIENSEDGFFFGDGLASFNKSRGFLADAKFAAACARNMSATDEERGRVWRVHTLTWAAKHALRLEGDFVECGVFQGSMSATVADYVDFAKTDRTFYLYDTFEGFSDRYSSREDFGIHEGFFDLAQEIYARPGLYSQVVARFGAYPNIKVIRGVVPDVLLGEAPERIAYCHIDLNSPAAEVGALEILFDRIVPGGLVIFDDYGWLPFARQQQAEDAFAGRRDYSILELPTGQGLLIKR